MGSDSGYRKGGEVRAGADANPVGREDGMNSISLVCTVHKEMGLANVSELRAILKRIQPEIIFLEVPPTDFDDYYENCS
jgi:hypothetical protein